jgi:L-ribulokinase
VINAGGIPRKSPVLNRIFASALDTPVLVPAGDPTSLGSAIFAFLAAGTFRSIEEAQQALCLDYTTIEPDRQDARACEELFGQFRWLYFSLGREDSAPVALGGLLRSLRETARAALAR